MCSTKIINKEFPFSISELVHFFVYVILCIFRQFTIPIILRVPGQSTYTIYFLWHITKARNASRDGNITKSNLHPT